MDPVLSGQPKSLFLGRSREGGPSEGQPACVVLFAGLIADTRPTTGLSYPACLSAESEAPAALTIKSDADAVGWLWMNRVMYARTCTPLPSPAVHGNATHTQMCPLCGNIGRYLPQGVSAAWARS